ncbi:MAG: FadR/GntR family transcriptional regulator [Rhodocyclaceae bacterium]|nr:FadR/GntR family transcriptional regulator [Rhodocyclaceae bacterium]
MTKRLGVQRISDAVAGELEARILEGSLKPGDRLPSERDLAVELGVSRPSLREAIQKLVSKGLLSSQHGGGTFVTDSLEAPFVDPWQQMLEGHPGLQGDMLEFRHMLEAEAAAMAARRATDADLERIEAALRAMEESFRGEDPQAQVDADLAFHQAIAEAAHNVLFGHMTSSLFRVIQGHLTRNLQHLRTLPEEWKELASQHRAIWLAIRDRQPEAAAAAARVHIDFVRASMQEHARTRERHGSALRRLGETA